MRGQVAHEGSGGADQKGEGLSRIAVALALALACTACHKAEHGATGAIALTDPEAAGAVPAAIAVLQSSSIATRVVNHLNLGADPYWGGNPEAAIRKLQSMVHARQRGALAQIEITVVEPNSKRAVQVCNVLLAVYLESRLQQRMMTVRVQPSLSPSDDQPLLIDARVIKVCTFK